MRLIGLLFIVGLASLIGCQKRTSFSEPQPSDKKDKLKFKKLYRGQYSNQNERLIIETDLIYRQVQYQILAHTSSLNICQSLPSSKMCQLISSSNSLKMNGDSVLLNYVEIDTLFKISDRNKLRYSNGYYFLNIQNNENQFETKLLSLTQDGRLTILEWEPTANALEDLNQIIKLPNLDNDSIELTQNESSIRQVRLENFNEEENHMPSYEFYKVKDDESYH